MARKVTKSVMPAPRAKRKSCARSNCAAGMSSGEASLAPFAAAFAGVPLESGRAPFAPSDAEAAPLPARSLEDDGLNSNENEPASAEGGLAEVAEAAIEASSI